jgi:peptidylprolyl isomerase
MMREGGKATLVIPPELAYGATGSGSIPPNAALTFDVELVQVVAAPEPADIALEDYQVTESGLRYFDIEVGAGDPPAVGDSVSLNFNAWLEDGTSLGGTEGGPPASLQVGMGQVFPGLDEGVASMRVGGKRQMLIPPELAFGDQGSATIPPNSTLIVEATMLNIFPVPEPSVFPEIDESDYTETASGLKYYDLKVGDGPTPLPTQQVQVHYTAWLEDGAKFDSSIDSGQAFPFVLGVGAVMPGWDEGVSTMKVGGIRILIIPPDLAYGSEGAGGVIPPDATLIFEVHLLDVQ